MREMTYFPIGYRFTTCLQLRKLHTNVNSSYRLKIQRTFGTK